MLSDIFFHQTVTYTRTEQEIIDFICKNPGVFLTASISQLADRLGISDASLSRLAKHAGYPDYKGLKAAVTGALSGAAQCNHYTIATPEKPSHAEVGV